MIDARKCISYLTIENKDSIPVELRPAIGNRVFGCDDCQIVCPWNRFSSVTEESAFETRFTLDSIDLVEAFQWSENEFHTKTQGSAIRRISFEQWLRNVAVALGNSLPTPDTLTALKIRQYHPSKMVREHVNWAIEHLEASRTR